MPRRDYRPQRRRTHVPTHEDYSPTTEDLARELVRRHLATPLILAGDPPRLNRKATR